MKYPDGPYHASLDNEFIAISMTDLQRFKRCRKSSDLTFHHGLEPLADREAMAKGRIAHALLEAYALSLVLPNDMDGRYEFRLTKLRNALAESDLGNLTTVVEQYINRKWDITPERLIAIEEPFYQPLLATGAAWNGKHDYRPSPALVIRATPDLIYKDADAWIVGREYKTFQKSATTDVDLDFQGMIEMAIMQRQFGTRRARFEYVNIRQTPPDTPKDKAGNCWTEQECYNVVDFYPSDAELDSIWKETQAVGRNLLGCLASDDPAEWYRTDLKGTSPHTCHTCLVKNLCKSEAMFGGLSWDTIEQYAKVREYVTLPNGLICEKPREFTPVHSLESLEV